MKKKLFLVTVISLFFSSLPAWADQCAYITKEQALIAASRLNLGDRIYLFCEPCGDRHPQQTTIKSLALKTVDYQNYWQVYINNKGIDLAYVFIPAKIDTYLLNLAAIAACPAVDVSPVLPK